jgi:hypothetical protein
MFNLGILVFIRRGRSWRATSPVAEQYARERAASPVHGRLRQRRFLRKFAQTRQIDTVRAPGAGTNLRMPTRFT